MSWSTFSPTRPTFIHNPAGQHDSRTHCHNSGPIAAVLDAGILPNSPDAAEDSARVSDHLAGAIKPLESYAAKLRTETLLAQSPKVYALAMLSAQVLADGGATTDAVLERLPKFDWSSEAEGTRNMRPVERHAARTRHFLAYCGMEPNNEPSTVNS